MWYVIVYCTFLLTRTSIIMYTLYPPSPPPKINPSFATVTLCSDYECTIKLRGVAGKAIKLNRFFFPLRFLFVCLLGICNLTKSKTRHGIRWEISLVKHWWPHALSQWISHPNYKYASRRDFRYRLAQFSSKNKRRPVVFFDNIQCRDWK